MNKSNILKKHLPAWNMLSWIIIVSLSVGLIGCIIISGHKSVFLMNESQLLYAFSTMAQVIAGMFGLTLTAYVFFADKFGKSAENEEDYEATVSLIRQYYWNLILIASVCALAIILSLLGIASLYNWIGGIYNFIIDMSVTCCVISTISIFCLEYFSCILIN